MTNVDEIVDYASAKPMVRCGVSDPHRSAVVTETLDCFLLTRQWRDTRDGLELTLWATSDKGPARVVLTREKAVCFIDHETSIGKRRLTQLKCERRSLDLATLHGVKVDGLYFQYQRDLVEFARQTRADRGVVYESDLKPVDRFLMERFITSGFTIHGEFRNGCDFVDVVNPRLKTCDYRRSLSRVYIDIETQGLSGELYSIAVDGMGESVVHIKSARPVTMTGEAEARSYAGETQLLDGFFAHIRQLDPDALCGWNVISFDLDFLEARCRKLGVEFALGRGNERATILRPQSSAGTHVARIPGRVVLDGIDVLKAAFWSFESFELETVAQELLGRGKTVTETDKVKEITRLYQDDKSELARYNLEDCRLVNEIFEHARLFDFATRRAQLTGLALDRFGGSVAAFDNLYLPRLHRRGKVAFDVEDVRQGPGSPGGYVMDSKPGLYKNVLLLDFKSLYPSLIRTFQVDPYAMSEPGDDPIPGFLEAKFARHGAILPELITELWSARDEAKKNADAPLSQAVKILMNSFYGVLAAEGCRFYDARLASSITRRGHEVIQASQQYLEDRGFCVIYGDTDSLFVWLGDDFDEPTALATGNQLAGELNVWWQQRLHENYRLVSHLEIEFETHFLRFLMPTVRGDSQGSKKRYAGLVRGEAGDKLVFKGLESVRTDWTALARNFQRELYRRVFADEPFEVFVQSTKDKLLAGELDSQLIYRKRLRRPIETYQKNIPPHVQAAKKLQRRVKWIEYVITPSGPEPVELLTVKPDYEHYLERQLAPAADALLNFLETSFDAITNAQMEIF